jgi:hypothetical protein
MEQAQKMKRALTDFFPLCRKWLIVALLALTLSGCETLYYLTMYPPMLLKGALEYVETAPERAIQEKSAQIDSNAAQAQKPLVQKARAYLKTACEQDERLFIKSGIELNKGILVLRNRWEDAPLPLLEIAPEEAAPDAIIAYRRFNYGDWNYKYRESRRESIRMFREIQYGYGIPWDDDDTLYEAWILFSLSAVEEPEFFIETGKGKYLQRASKAFWEQAGLRERVLNESPQARCDKGFSASTCLYMYEANPKQTPFDLPVDAPLSAKYALSIEDISTLEDRAHWVARGRLRLIERESGEAVAEYVGFAANIKPGGMQAKSPSRRWKNTSSERWNDQEGWLYTGDTELCPNAAEKPEWIVHRFLQKILYGKQP